MPSRARSLAEDLRQRSDDELERLFRLRPHLVLPVPKSFADLALRANSAPATITALDDLTRAELDVLEAACALAVGGRFGVAELAAGLDASADLVTDVVTSLLDRVLLWGATDDLRVPSAVREAFGGTPGGFDATPRADLPVIRAAVADPENFRAEIAEAPEPARVAAMTAAWGPPKLPEPTTPDQEMGQTWLLERGLLVRDELGVRTLPREVALLLRGGLLLPDPQLAPPEPPSPDISVDDAAGHAADQFVREHDRVLTELGRYPWARSANGGIGARDWERALGALALDPGRLALHMGLAWAGGQVGVDRDGRLVPASETPADNPIAQRWALLVAGWIGLPRAVPGDPARVLAAREDPLVPLARRLVLTGLAADAGYDIAQWLAWYRPRVRLPARLVNELLAEAAALGLCVGAVPAAVTRTLAWPVEAPALAAAVAPTLPDLTDRIVLQADLTATALGPLYPTVERRLATVADWESGGAATVFRFTADSVRRGLTHEDPEVLTTWLASLSVAPLPQALAVLITDQHRRGVPATVHSAQAVVTCAPEVVAAVVGDASLADLGLRPVADGVLVSAQPARVVVARLRAAGHDVATGDHDDPVTAEQPEPAAKSGPTPARVVRSLRMVEQRGAQPAEQVPRIEAAGPHAVRQQLHDASGRHSRIWLAFAEQSGQRITHLVEPLSVADGDVCAFDLTAGEIRVIPLERVVGAAPADA